MKAIICVLFTLSALGTSLADPDACVGKDDGTLLPVMGDCSKYYSCVGEMPYEFRCPSPMLFDRKAGWCDYPENVKDCSLECPSSEGVTQEPSLASCREYILCVGGTPYVRDCGQGYEFDKVEKRCKLAGEARCDVDGCDGKPDGSFQQGRKCNEYFVCFQNKGYQFTCTAGTEYDPWQERCAPAEEVQCSISNAHHVFFSKHWPEKPPTTTSVDCQTQRIEFLPSPTDPDYFFVCFKGHSHLLRCPVGQIFDRVSKICLPLLEENKNHKK